tara:strand:+ start:529 stop:798 length:270 start_codon:yes stop_codon:yes gene_type:complete
MIDIGDVQIDTIGWYDAESGSLESVTINKRELTVAQISAALFILCPDDAGPWADDLDGAELDVLVNEAANDARDDRGDWKRDMQMEATR